MSWPLTPLATPRVLITGVEHVGSSFAFCRLQRGLLDLGGPNSALVGSVVYELRQDRPNDPTTPKQHMQYLYGPGSTPMVAFWGRSTTHISLF